jgi:hypothetical protein
MSLMMSSIPSALRRSTTCMSWAEVRPNLDFSPARLRPAARALARELDAHADRRRHAHLARDRQQHVELAHLLDDDEHGVPELLAHEGEAHELLVLVAVADDEVIGAVGQREDGLQLGLGAALESDAGCLAELDDLLDHVALLVHLDRIDGRVLPLVLELGDGAREAGVQHLDARLEDLREPQEHGEVDALGLEVVRELEEVERLLGTVLVGAHDDAPGRLTSKKPSPHPSMLYSAFARSIVHGVATASFAAGVGATAGAACSEVGEDVIP